MIYLSRAQVRQIDQRCIETFGLPGIVLMENAARSVVDVAADMLGEKTRVTIVCGPGNNGGDGFAVARHLYNAGKNVAIFLAADPRKYHGDALTNFNVVQKMKLKTIAEISDETDLIIDAIFGTGLTRPPENEVASLIEKLNEIAAPRLSVDIPSGLDCDRGVPLGACIRADKTVTFVAFKLGFRNPASREFTGEVVVGDIGCPRELIAAVQSNR